MNVHPTITHQNGIVNVQLTATFVGDVTDATDKQRITAYGDPFVNMGGTFVDPNDPTFTFNTGASDYNVRVTTEMSSKLARFLKSLPLTTPGTAPSQLGPLDVVTSDPVRAATIYNTIMGDRIQVVMTALRALTPPALTSLPDKTV